MNDPQASRRAHLKSAVACAPGAQSLVEVLRRAAAERPQAMYLDLLDAQNQPHELTFLAVLQGAERWARWLAAKKLERGSRIALLLPTGDDFLFAFFGTQIAGLTPVPCAFPLTLGNQDAYVASLAPILVSARPALLVTTAHLEESAKKLLALAPSSGCELVLPTQVADPGPGATFPEIGPDDVALIQYASGRVCTPTGVVLPHRQVLANVFGLGTALRLTSADVALTWVPLIQDMGLIGGLFTSLYWRCPLHVMPPQLFLMHPYRWLQNVGRFKVTLAAAPNAGYQLCVKRTQERHFKDMDLSTWRLALNGAETVHPATVKAFCEKFAPAGFDPRAMCPTYGIAENTLATSIPDLAGTPFGTDALAGGAPVTTLGGPLAGQELAILDEQGAILPARTEGEVVVRGPCVMRGYWGEPALTARTIDAQGWLHTGDLGFVSEGRLALTGRKKDMVIKMGRNYYPSDVEGVLSSFAPLKGGAAMALASPNAIEGTEDLVLLYEGEPLDAEATKQLGIDLNAQLLSKLGIRADKLVRVSPGGLAGSREGAGRAKLRRLFSEGRLA